MDAANTGEWEMCVAVDNTGLPDNWATRAHIGLTATTGALADNHDILALKTYSDQAVMELEDEEDKKKTNFALSEDSTHQAQLNR